MGQEKEEKRTPSIMESKPIADNMQKYNNYREQMGRLNKALKQKFYLEAIFIEYSIMEDRLESILRHAGEWERMYQKAQKRNGFVSIDTKLNKIIELSRKKRSLEEKYFSDILLENVRVWKNERNPLTHALLKRNLHTEDLEQVALKGLEITKKLCSRVTSYRRAVEKANVSIDRRPTP